MTHWYWANALAGLKDFDGALEQMEQAVSLDPRAALQTNLGAIQAVRGNLVEAEAAFRQAVATDPKSIPAQVALGQFLWGTGKLAEAEAAFKTAASLDPANQLPGRALARFYMLSGRAPEAEPYLKKAVEASATVDAQLALADYYIGMERPADALAVLEKLAADQRYWALARARIAGIQHAQGKTSDAFHTVEEVIAKQPALAPARVVRGRLLLADGRIDEALTDAQEAVKLDPKNAEAHYLLGMVQEARRDVDAAAAAYAEVLKLNPRATTVQVRLAMLEMQRNALPAATQLAEQAAAAQPDNIVAQLILGRSLIARGDLNRGAAVTKALLERAPQSAGVQSLAGMVALARKDNAAARTAFENALARDGRLVEPLSALVALDLDEKKPEKARARIEARLKQTPHASAVLVLAGRTWAATGDQGKAEEFLKRAIDADASNVDAYSMLAGLYLSARRFDEALAGFDKLTARQPNAVGPPTMAGIVLQAAGREADARQRFERLVEANPHAAVASNNLAFMYAVKGEQLDRALQLAQAAKAEIPDHPEVNDTLGFVYLKKQLPSLAIPPLRLAVEKDPGNPSFLYHLGQAYAQTGDNASARRSLERALALKPDFDGAQDARKLLKTLG